MNKRFALLFLLLLILLLSACGKTTPNDVIKTVKDGGYVKANEMYTSKIVGNLTAEKAVKDGLKEMLESAVSEFASRKIAYDDAMQVVEKVEKASICDAAVVQDVRDRIGILKHAEQAYVSGQDLMASGSYESAMYAFREVDKISPVYDDAMERRLLQRRNW